jgi:chemotaxis receptor (MCP) glutamine deamidase CheD|tara:strand:+ start:203 stop:388 length:186 start_codon:yes stop_codon:yes gene_type:complete
MISKYIEVEQFEMKKAYYPDSIGSGGLGPCIAISIYDFKTRSGYMMHESDFQKILHDLLSP